MRSNSLFLLAALAAVPLRGQAQATATPLVEVKLKEERPGLLAQAKVTDAAARQAALAKVPGGSIVQAEIEMEKGTLIYSYDVRVMGKAGIEEVAVDARTGAILSVEHESAADEAAEKADSAQTKHP